MIVRALLAITSRWVEEQTYLVRVFIIKYARITVGEVFWYKLYTVNILKQ